MTAHGARRYRPRLRIPKRRSMWTGFNRLNFTQGSAVTTATVLFDPAVYQQTLIEPTLLAIRGNLSIRSTGSVSAGDILSMYVQAFQTDGTETVPAGLIYPPGTQDIEVAEKSLLWTQVLQVPVVGDVPINIDINIRTKRKLSPALAVMLVANFTDDTDKCRITGALRSLVAL